MAIGERETKIQAIVEPTLDALGYALVRVQLSAGSRPTLQIMAERQDGEAMSIDDCTTISHALSAKLDVEDPIASAYSLEVSSPGIDRPLIRPADFRRFQGCAARIETRMKISERRRFSGPIVAVSDTHVRLRFDPVPGAAGEVDIPYDQISRARLAPDLDIAGGEAASSAPRHDHRSNGTVRQ